MQRKRQKKLSQIFNLKAVDDENNTIWGILRMGASDSVYYSKVNGICGVFETDENRKQLWFDAESLFFYGRTKDLMDNYHTHWPPASLDLTQYIDKPFAQRAHSYCVAGDPKLGYMLIPLDKLGLGASQQSLVDMLVSEVPEQLPKLMNKIVRIQIDTDNLRTVGKALASVPLELKEKAIENSSFYRNYYARESTTVEIITLPNIVVISTPMGGMPEWAKNYMRKLRE